MPHQCTGCGHTFEDGSKEMLSGCPDCGGNTFQFRPAGTGSNDSSADTSAEPPASDPPAPSDLDTSSVAETVGRATTRVRDFVSQGPEYDPTEADRTDPNPDAEWPDDWSADPSEAAPERSDRSPDRETPCVEEETDDDIIDADARRRATTSDQPGEDLAQASARSDVVTPDELGDRKEDSADETATGSTSDATAASSTATEASPPTDGEIVSEPTGEEPDLADLREQLNDQFESIKILEPGQYELNLMELYDREEYIIALQENGRYVIQVPEQWIGEDIEDR